MKCKPYSEITVEIRTQLKTVKITSNIFAVYRRTLLGKNDFENVCLHPTSEKEKYKFAY